MGVPVDCSWISFCLGVVEDGGCDGAGVVTDDLYSHKSQYCTVNYGQWAVTLPQVTQKRVSESQSTALK